MTELSERKQTIDYSGFIDEAMRGVVRRALRHVAQHGLPESHHFYISFATDYPGVSISPALKARYPKEITIVLQFQFWDLDVRDQYFSVMLSFNNIPEKLVVPYHALTAFSDPGVKFGLQFHVPVAETVQKAAAETSFDLAAPHTENGGVASTPVAEPAASAEVISLDAFRKK
jgi:hypothetical protein